MAGATLKVPVKDFDKLMRKLGDAAPVALKAGLLSVAMRARLVMDQESVRKRVMNTGYYRRAWKAFNLFDRDAVRVYNVAPYAGVIEYGRRPGGRMPPTDAIARWAERKFSIPYEDARGIAFGIAKKIQKTGIPGKHVLVDAMPRLETVVEHEVRRELLRAVGMLRP